MKSTCAILFAAMAAAVPAPVPATGPFGSATNPLRFIGRLNVPGGNLPGSTGTTVDANSRSFWFGKYTWTYSELKTPQANTDTTIFRMAVGEGTLFLDTQDVEGQAVYVNPDGELKFRAFHPFNGEADDAIYKGFDVVEHVTKLQFEGKDFIACPVGAKDSGDYQIFAASRAHTAKENCTPFEWKNEFTTKPAAYSYI
ncbi:unnamed protein product [Zymoseptoria tritici ST99CH_1A5]|uniref:Uncharacterized protein n=4 Tax=Zymoseptoria tritici TaxID=1047171 RepID=F9XB50_ZYMTI|nr:uncharacterized protein MYCGRDRAFT_109679 [Zymoseptoria tritici IPO323]SMQ51301.1 unnamed protein product [Zymoseptoria tritici ST99CH_3D7]SMR53205.1 unnamed protein product [Zymoseptoria tritici ST99CH_1E4]SMR54878.1 unnamed protein product [Zymoseptoria tritici ST99CH_3D1]SMY24950.1 unnamed protein product [Zymoseptoria tritici ST99CH_1A5]EGP87359.1 hypothetical protein MYCGRDRAFT_109679 [Zymoseptoria tritici IPO323]